jgi:SulP family sulfate permease
VLEGAAEALAHPERWEAAPIVLALVAVALLVVGPRLHPLFPFVLVAVGIGIAYSELAGYDGATVGSIESGAPPISAHLPWGELEQVLLPGAIIALVGFAEPASIARTLAARERRPWNANREFLGQGLANVVSGFTGGFPVGGSFSRSMLGWLAGARTRLSGAITGVCVLAFLPFAGSLSSLPRATLAGVVIGAALPLVRVGPLLRLWRFSKPQFAVAWITFALTLALSPHIERAVLIGIGLAIAVHLWRELDFDIDVRRDGDELHLRPSGVLWFGTARALDGAFLRLLAESPDARRLVLHMDGLGRVDLPGALALRQLLEDARQAGLDVELADVPQRARRFVEGVLLEPRDPLAPRRE